MLNVTQLYAHQWRVLISSLRTFMSEGPIGSHGLVAEH